MDKVIKINKNDIVGVALADCKIGEVYTFDGVSITLQEDIALGHKFALKDIDEGENIIKYGAPIGHATQKISQGTWVHTHNMKTNLGDVLTYTYNPVNIETKATEKRTFKGYRRKNGKVGVRNEIWIIPTVGCLNSVIGLIANETKHLKSEHVEEVVAFPHPYGCSQMGGDQENTRRILADLIQHPNAGGVLVLGLGCENSNLDILKTYLHDFDTDRVRFLQSQDCEDEVEEAVKIIEELAQQMELDERVEIDCSELIVGLKCGGSDGLSGITANPTVGEFSDMLVTRGGSTILTEVPEMFGAETILMNRAKNEAVFDKMVELINGFKDYFVAHDQTIYENPSPGNKKGGISSLEDKSLGCTQKSGSSVIVDVLDYGQVVNEKGLNLLNAPGNDLVAATALAASGAHIVLFTTGRGTPFASPVPTIKISSNSAMYHRKSNWIDFNCGVLVEGQSMEQVKNDFFDFVLEIASGKHVKAEENGYHDMAIFKDGVTL